jgi:excisionase family DNA binding protein
MSTVVGQFVSVSEAAEILGCTDGRIRQMLRAGEIEGIKLNERAWAIPKKAAEKAAKNTPTTGRPRISAQTT